MKRNINLFYAYEQENKKPLERGKVIALGVLAAVILINGALMGTFLVMNLLKSKEIDKLNAYFSESTVAAERIKISETEGKLKTVEHDILLLHSLKSHLGTVSRFETNIYNIIDMTKPNNVNLVSFSYENEIVEINCTTPNNLPPADFTKALEATGMFSSVVYRGFSEGSENTVVFPVTCTLKGGANE